MGSLAYLYKYDMVILPCDSRTGCPSSDFAFGAFADNHFPTACNNKPMTPQEKALEFIVFDLSSCVQADRAPVVIP